jgi:hypothetical protein
LGPVSNLNRSFFGGKNMSFGGSLNAEFLGKVSISGSITRDFDDMGNVNATGSTVGLGVGVGVGFPIQGNMTISRESQAVRLDELLKITVKLFRPINFY